MARDRSAKTLELPYRPCVGIMLLNSEGRVWVGRRTPKWLARKATPIWQMPQGGIDAGEEPAHAAARELEEETGITSAVIIGEIPGWLSYELPDELLGVALKGRYRGQRQRWFAMRFTGRDDEVDIGGRRGQRPEFNAWRWVDIDELPGLIVPLKRDTYLTVVRQFEHFAR